MHFALRRVGTSRRSLAGRSAGREEQQGKRHPRCAGNRVKNFERTVGLEAAHHGDLTVSEERLQAFCYGVLAPGVCGSFNPVPLACASEEHAHSSETEYIGGSRRDVEVLKRLHPEGESNRIAR